jgi:hypothetical protein
MFIIYVKKWIDARLLTKSFIDIKRYLVILYTSSK